MARAIPLQLQTTYAELIERAELSAIATFPVEGSFFRRTLKGREYWYFQGAVGPDGKRKQRYVGPDSDELRRHIDAHGRAKQDDRERRDMVGALRRTGLTGPDSLTGRILVALAEAGVFRMRGVVVGTVAFQCYGGLLGAKLGAAAALTSDLDLAQFPSVSIAVGDTIDMPLIELLRKVDPAFRPVPHQHGEPHVTCYALGERYRVDILAPNEGSDTDEPLPLPALQAEGEPLRFLDFLIYQEVRAVALYGGGVLVNVPAPERYALHKLIVSRERLSTGASQAKAAKDLVQASELLEVLLVQRPFELRDVWQELLDRGAGWRARVGQGLVLLPNEAVRRSFVAHVGAEALLDSAG